MAGRRISSLLNLSSMSLGNNSINNNRRPSDQSMSASEAKASLNRRNFSRPAGGSSHNGSFSGSYPSSPAPAGLANANSKQQQQQQQPQQQVQTPLSENAEFIQLPPLPPPPPAPLNEETSGQSGGRPASRWGRLSRPSSRAASRSNSPRPNRSTDAVNELSSDAQSEGQKPRNGRGWLRSRSRSRSTSNLKAGPTAWIAGLDKKIGYNVTPLMNAERVPELWNPEGETFIYLYPKNSGCGPSFRVESSLYSSSALLARLAHGSLYTSSSGGSTQARRKTSLEGGDSTIRNVSHGSHTPPGDGESTGSSKGSRVLSDASEPINQEIHLYLPIDPEVTSPKDTKQRVRIAEMLIKVRNLFAFLLGQSLVATTRAPDTFSIFLGISDMLQMYDFSNLDSSTYGEVANTSFEEYVEELRMTDVRTSPEKTIEALVIAEKMRSTSLYNEAFVHAVGKHEDIKKLGSPKYDMISPITRNRMERATMDLFMRLKNVHARLNEFEFPDIFSGVMNSRTADERKIVRFDEWKSSFMATRRAVLLYYKKKYGSWPPKASSKKNDLATSGLNRLVLTDLYDDFSSLYDLLVDRTKLTTRSLDISVEEDEADNPDEMITRAMRRVLGEYDNSMPPVQPPVPFDCPMLPSLASILKPNIAIGSPEEKRARGRKLKDDKLRTVLRASQNQDAISAANKNVNATTVKADGKSKTDTKSSPVSFLQFFLAFENSTGKNKTIEELADLRSGQWLFMYAVLQSLPLLVVDAPGLRYTEGVEYFLCQPSRHGTSWARGDDAGPRMHWYGVTGSNGVVSMPADVVEYGVEGVYRRSHCWKVAEQWIKALHPPSENQGDQAVEPELEQEPEPEYLPEAQPLSMAGLPAAQCAQYPPGQFSPMHPLSLQSSPTYPHMMTPPLMSAGPIMNPHQYQQMQQSMPTPPSTTSMGSMTYPPIQAHPYQMQNFYPYPPGPPQPWLSSHPSSPSIRVDSLSQSPVTLPKMEVEDADLVSPELPIMHPGSPDQPQQQQQQQPPPPLLPQQQFPPSPAASSFTTAPSAQSPAASAAAAGQSPYFHPYQFPPNVNYNASFGQFAQASYPSPQRSPSPQVFVTPSLVSSNSRSGSPDDSSTVSSNMHAPYHRQHQHSSSLSVASAQLHPSRSFGLGVAGAGRSKRQSVMDLGLEALPVPAGVMPTVAVGGGGGGGGGGGLSKQSRAIKKNPSITFDAIIGSGNGDPAKGGSDAAGSAAKRPGTAGTMMSNTGRLSMARIDKKKKAGK